MSRTLGSTPRGAEALQKKVQELNRKLDQKTAHELGEFPEIDLYQALSEAFPGDKIRRVRKGEQGADIVHEVMHNGRYCETIIYDSKNRRLWQKLFVEKLLTDKVNAKAEHAILVSAVFPTGQRDLCVVDDVVVAKLSQVVTIAQLLRDGIIADHLRKLSFKDRTEKKERLYKPHHLRDVPSADGGDRAGRPRTGEDRRQRGRRSPKDMDGAHCPIQDS